MAHIINNHAKGWYKLDFQDRPCPVTFFTDPILLVLINGKQRKHSTAKHPPSAALQ